MNDKIKNIVVTAALGTFIGGFSLWGILAPDKASSESERRSLKQMPQLNADTVRDGSFMSDFESYSLDQFPMRDTFRSLKAMTVYFGMQKKDNNQIYIVKDYVSKLDYPLKTDSLDYAADRVNYIYDKYIQGTNSDVYFSIVPDKNYFLAEQNSYPAMDYSALADHMQKRTEFAEYIDIFPALSIEDYYRTDTHWKQERIFPAAKVLAEGMGQTLRDNYQICRSEHPFRGVYYGQCGLPLREDEICYVQNDALKSCRVFDYETNAEIPVYDMNKAAGKDAYEMYLSGPKSLLTIENPQASSEKELVLFRDSFGSSLSPYFVEAYSRITIVDTRYLHPDMLGKFIDFNDKDILFLYSSLVLNSSSIMK